MSLKIQLVLALVFIVLTCIFAPVEVRGIICLLLGMWGGWCLAEIHRGHGS